MDYIPSNIIFTMKRKPLIKLIIKYYLNRKDNYLFIMNMSLIYSKSEFYSFFFLANKYKNLYLYSKNFISLISVNLAQIIWII